MGEKRRDLADLLGEEIVGHGALINVAKHEHGASVLLRGVVINDKLWYDHLWIKIRERDRRALELEPKEQTIVYFSSSVERYEEDRYGLTTLHIHRTELQ